MNPARLLLLLVIVIMLVLILDGTATEIILGLPKAARYMARFGLSLERLDRIGPDVLETLVMAVKGTVLGFTTAMPLTYLASRNMTPSAAVYVATRFVLSLMRGIPPVVLGILFVAAVGLGPLAGVLGLWFHTTAVLGKYMSESFEAANPEVLDAASVDGATRWQSYILVLVPMQANAVLSHVMYRLEVNFRSATILGIVGAGGIGLELTRAIGYFDYGSTGLILLVIVGIAFCLDTVSRLLRSRVL